MKGGWVYIVTNRALGALYTGVTNDIARRAWEHRQRMGSGFTARYGIDRLVYMERHEDIEAAIKHETRIKHWRRSWKLDLIEMGNPGWEDLFDWLNS